MTAYATVTSPSERVAVYVDGFNFYHGMMAKEWGAYRWLDFGALLGRRIREGQELVALRYFSALVTHQPEKLDRQDIYMRALLHQCGINPILGEFEMRNARCTKCAAYYKRPQEKRTDVNIATHLVADAYEDLFDVAFLICADGDLLPAVKRVQALGKTVCLIDPPRRHSDDLAAHANFHWHFSRAHVAGSQLPNPVEWIDRRGKTRRIYAPEGWTTTST